MSKRNFISYASGMLSKHDTTDLYPKPRNEFSVLFSVFKTGSWYVTQAGLNLTIQNF
jgi:hypothetical protein